MTISLASGPVLDGKMDINVTRKFGRDTVVDHVDSRHVVFVEQSRTMLWVSHFKKDSNKILCVVGQCELS